MLPGSPRATQTHSKDNHGGHATCAQLHGEQTGARRCNLTARCYRAFAFLGRRILFVGHEAFDAEELGNLLPDGVGWYEQQYAPEEYVADIVVLGREFSKGLVKSVLGELKGSPKVIPQEGFLDELLFGHDWWSGKRESLQEMINSHRGLQSAKSLGAYAQLA
jgi:hypothetical protein